MTSIKFQYTNVFLEPFVLDFFIRIKKHFGAKFCLLFRK